MAKFYVGQPVRIIAVPGFSAVETTVTGGPFLGVQGSTCYGTAYSDAIRSRDGYGIKEEYLRPLEDPKASEFIEKMNQFNPVKEPVDA